jgi:hypothetical protein
MSHDRPAKNPQAEAKYLPSLDSSDHEIYPPGIAMKVLSPALSSTDLSDVAAPPPLTCSREGKQQIGGGLT